MTYIKLLLIEHYREYPIYKIRGGYVVGRCINTIKSTTEDAKRMIDDMILKGYDANGKKII
jgi:hypothetical protein